GFGESGSRRQQEGVVSGRGALFQHLVSHAGQPASAGETALVCGVPAGILRFRRVGTDGMGTNRAPQKYLAPAPGGDRDRFRLRLCLWSTTRSSRRLSSTEGRGY